MSRHVSRVAIAVAVLAGAAACSPSADTAATVNGTVISMEDVEEMGTITEAAQGVEVPAASLVGVLVFGEIVADTLGESESAPDDAAIAEFFDLDSLQSVSPQVSNGLEYLYYGILAQQGAFQITEETNAEVTEKVSDADVEINPRFGTWDTENFSITQGADYLTVQDRSVTE